MNGRAAAAEEPVRLGVATTRRILVPLDGSALAEQALPYVCAIGQANHVQVTLLRVLDPGGTPVDPLEWELRRRQAVSYLSTVQAELQAKGTSATVEVLQGRPAEQIMHLAATRNVDLTILTSHGEGGLGQWPLSSTVQKVIASGSTSVLIVPIRSAEPPPPRDFTIRKVLLALDCSPRAEVILPAAIELAQRHDAELILAHVVPEPELPRRLSPSAHDLDLARELTERNRLEAERYLKQLQNRMAQSAGHTEIRTVVSARSAQALRDLAASEGADLVLIAAHGFTGDATAAYGTVAARLLQDANVPIMVVKDLEVLRE